MPFKSQKQEAYFNANKATLESHAVNVENWNKASKGLKLPKKVKQPKPKATLSEFMSE